MGMGGQEGGGEAGAGEKWGQVGSGGRWEAEDGLKQPLGLKQHCCAFSLVPELVQSTGWAKTAVRSSLVPHAVL